MSASAGGGRQACASGRQRSVFERLSQVLDSTTHCSRAALGILLARCQARMAHESIFHAAPIDLLRDSPRLVIDLWRLARGELSLDADQVPGGPSSLA